MPRLLFCAVLAMVCPAGVAQGQAQPRTFQVTTAPGVSLEVIDWGGSGRPLVFLPGGGLSAHQFDDFAPPLTDRYRVLGISRRGSGASSDVPPDSLGELVADIVAVMDSLRLRRAVLIGHSFAGTEMALFGEKHPGRCAGLIYLDAAYDYTDVEEIGRIFTQTPPPPPPPMTAADSASLQAVRAYGERINRFRMPDAEIRGLHRWDAGGRMVERIISQTQKRQGALVRAPRWEAVQCPSLAMYAVPAPLETWLGWYHTLDADQRAAGQAYVREFGRWTAGQRAKFGSHPQNRVVEFPTGNHYFFQEMPGEARRVIRDFLSSLP